MKTKRKFLNPDKSMPGAILLEPDYHYKYKNLLEGYWVKIGDCSRTISLEFGTEYLDVSKNKKAVTKQCEKNRQQAIKKATIIRDIMQEVIDEFEAQDFDEILVDMEE